MTGASPPIDIVSSHHRYSSTSPGNHSSNLTSALQKAGSSSPQQQDTSAPYHPQDRRPTAVRQDSLGAGLASSNTPTRPISVAAKARKESGPGSYMGGGMSFGGISFSSYLQDDIMMSGLSPNVNSPSFHSSSYLPRMEADFWNNLKCCDIVFNNLHELVAHFEGVHRQHPSNFHHQIPGIGNDRGLRRKSSGMDNDSLRPPNQMRGFQNAPDSRINGTQPSRLQQPFQDGYRKASLSGVQDMDTIGQMDMDDDHMSMGQNLLYQQQNGQFSGDTTPRVGSSGMNFQNMMNGQQGYGNTTSPTMQTNYGFDQHNPMVSSVNTPTFGAVPQTQHQNRNSMNFNQATSQPGADQTVSPQFTSNQVPFNPQMLQRTTNDFGNLDFGPNGTELLDLCINEPAKNLYSADGVFNSSQYPHFGFANNNNVTNNGDENARKLQAQRLAAGTGRMQTEEERPFKCPVIGCEKAYKNANGLRYHEKHGHSNQKLKDNGDGSFSIVDPVTSMPYPGTVGMEKEKPYRCDVCGKRYKNLNGLKYHRNHSPPCNPDFNMNNVPGIQNDLSMQDGDGDADFNH